MERYVQLISQLMSYVGHHGFGDRRPVDNAVVTGADSCPEDYPHEAFCTIRGVTFRGFGIGRTKKDAKKVAHRELAWKIFPHVVPVGTLDAPAANAMHTAFAAAKIANAVEELLRPGLEQQAANPEPGLPADKSAPYAGPAASGTPAYGAAYRTPSPAPAPVQHFAPVTRPEAYPARHSPVPAAAAAAAAPYPMSQPGPPLYARSAAMSPYAVSSMPAVARPPYAHSPSPPVHRAPQPVAPPVPQLPSVPLSRQYPELLLATAVQALGDLWTPELIMDCSDANRVDFGQPPMLRIARGLTIRVTLRFDAAYFPPQLLDGLLSQEWIIRVRRGEDIIRRYQPRGHLSPLITRRTMEPGERTFMLELMNDRTVDVYRPFWDKLMAAARALEQHRRAAGATREFGHLLGSVKIPELVPASGPVIERLPAEFVAHLPETAQALHRHWSQDTKRGPGGRVDPVEVERFRAKVPCLGNFAGRLVFRGIVVEHGVPFLAPLSVSTHLMDFTADEVPNGASVVDEGSLARQVVKTLDYLLVLGTEADLAQLYALFHVYFSDESTAARGWGTFWSRPALRGRLRDLFYLHCSHARILPTKPGAAEHLTFPALLEFLPAGATCHPQDTPELLRDILQDAGGLGRVAAVTLEGRLRCAIADPTLRLDPQGPLPPAARQCIEAATHMVIRLTESGFLPKGRLSFHHAPRSPHAWVFRNGVHHINLRDNWFYAFLVDLPSHRAAASPLLRLASKTFAPTPPPTAPQPETGSGRFGDLEVALRMFVLGVVCASDEHLVVHRETASDERYDLRGSSGALVARFTVSGDDQEGFLTLALRMNPLLMGDGFGEAGLARLLWEWVDDAILWGPFSPGTTMVSERPFVRGTSGRPSSQTGKTVEIASGSRDLLPMFLPGEGTAPFRFVVRMRFTGAHRFRRELASVLDPETWLCTERAPLGQAMLSDATLAGKVFFRGFLVAVGGFPFGALSYDGPPPLLPGTTCQPDAVVHPGSLETAWRQVLETRTGEVMQFWEEVSEAAEPASGTMESVDLGPILGQAGMRSLMAQRILEGLAAGGRHLVPLRDGIERWVWDRLPDGDRCRGWVAHPAVHALLKGEDFDMEAELVAWLSDETTVVKAEEVLPQDSFIALAGALRALGLMVSDQDEVVFHDVVRLPLLYCRVGEIHHMAARFQGAELLRQMLLSVGDEDRLRVQCVLAEALDKTGDLPGFEKRMEVVEALANVMTLDNSTWRRGARKRPREYDLQLDLE